MEFLEKFESESGLISPALAERPHISPDMMEYLFAFRILSATRSQGMALEPITFRDILSYIDRYGTPYPSETGFIEIMIEMDKTYRKAKVG